MIGRQLILVAALLLTLTTACKTNQTSATSNAGNSHPAASSSPDQFAAVRPIYGPALDGSLPGALQLDSLGNIFVAGLTYSADFPITPNAFQQGNNAFTRNSTPFSTT